MALQSLTGNGIRAGRYDQLRRLVVMTYGFHHTFTLNNLEKIGERHPPHRAVPWSKAVWCNSHQAC